MPPKRPAPLLQDSQLSLFDVAPEITPAEPGAPRARRELVLGQHRIGYELKRARRRSIGFVVGPQGLRVSAPRWVPVTDIERALHHKGEWILRKLVEQRERAIGAREPALQRSDLPADRRVDDHALREVACGQRDVVPRDRADRKSVV